MSLFQALLADGPSEPPIPASFGVSEFNVAGTGHARVSARQLALEPSVAGVDRAMSWSFMVRQTNIGVEFQRVWANGLTAAGDIQWNFAIRSQTETGSFNQCVQFAINTNSTNFILIQSSFRLLKSRWHHVCVTYSGSEAASGLKLYHNAVEDTAATKSTTGTYTGALNNASLRVQLSSVFVSTQRFKGNLRDCAIWNRVLTLTEIEEIYNNGSPMDVATASFYGSAIEAYWPLASALTCSNNATFNYGSSAGLSFGTRPVSTLYPSFSIQNARIGNTRYVAFNSALRIGGVPYIWIRDGLDHTDSGRIDKATFDVNNLLAATPVTWDDGVITASDDLRSLQTGVISGQIFGFTSKFDDPTQVFLSSGRYLSSDGQVGEAFGAYISMETPVAGHSINFYGNMFEGDNAGEYFVPFHDYTVAAQTIYLYHTTDFGANWSKITCFSGGAGDGYNEPYVIKTSAGYIMLVREQAGASLSCSVSTDNCVTWSAPVNSGLSVGVAMASMCLDDDGNIVVFYADRGDGFAKISLGNVPADIIADPTDWVAASNQFKTIDGTNNILGYPFILNMGGGFFAGGVSSEFSSTRADFFVAYGAFGAG